jgi:hypothetical protein
LSSEKVIHNKTKFYILGELPVSIKKSKKSPERLANSESDSKGSVEKSSRTSIELKLFKKPLENSLNDSEENPFHQTVLASSAARVEEEGSLISDLTVGKPSKIDRKSRAQNIKSSVTDSTITSNSEKGTGTATKVVKETIETPSIPVEQPVKRERKSRAIPSFKQPLKIEPDTSLRLSVVDDTIPRIDEQDKRVSRSMNLRKRPTEVRTCEATNLLINSVGDLTCGVGTSTGNARTPEVSISQPLKRERQSRARPPYKEIEKIEQETSTKKLANNESLDHRTLLDHPDPSIHLAESEKDSNSRTYSLLPASSSIQSETTESESSESHTPQPKRTRINKK